MELDPIVDASEVFDDVCGCIVGGMKRVGKGMRMSISGAGV